MALPVMLKNNRRRKILGSIADAFGKIQTRDRRVTRINMPHDGDDDFKLFTKSGELIATGYKRIVFGKRGPYLEFEKEQIIKDNIYLPDEFIWRFSSQYKNIVFYYEYRTKKDYVKIYLQKKKVSYADYKIGLCYISPFDLYDKNMKLIIGK